MDRLMSMRVFVTAAELQSFSGAAKALGISAPMVGKHINALEDHLGITLFHRTTRRMNMSDLGRVYYERCTVILNDVDATDALVKELSHDVSGTLRITMPVLFGKRLIAPILFSASKKYENLNLDLYFDDSAPDILTERFDLAIRSGFSSLRQGFASRHLISYPMIVCCSPLFAMQHAVNDLVELNDCTGLFYSRSGQVRPWRFPKADGRTLEIVPQCRLILNDIEAIADASEAGLGAAWLPSWLVQSRIDEGRLVRLCPEQETLQLNYYLIWPKSEVLPAKTRVILDLLRSSI
ncbi:LysR family transcriptional regulator [Gluconobacter thailandicus]|uniref:LysR family transcriptional regulator n=1 Tax=Gluconobacter thailandicus TaxID=257438 RepID=A0AAP9EQ52_GLUTH|nr:LysR family transcriptional regulator [Gluconobacter thailandicus]QEH94905.1 LysR family transcriptional regulator [Gluconobacter thailandicus]